MFVGSVLRKAMGFLRMLKTNDEGEVLVRIQGSVALNPESMSTSQANYVATADGTGYSIGNQITATMWWDTSNPANPAFLIAAFYNWETNLEISPNMAHLKQTGGDALTITQLQAENLADNAKLDELKGLIGEVQESPTANTVLDRLKTLALLLPAAQTVLTLNAATSVAIGDLATATTIFASNTSARLRTLTNGSTAILYLKYGSGASATDYHIKLAADDYWESPVVNGKIYDGIITGIWASDAGGFAYPAEFV